MGAACCDLYRPDHPGGRRHPSQREPTLLQGAIPSQAGPPQGPGDGRHGYAGEINNNRTI